MNRLDILYFISAIYTVLGIWGAVEAFFLKIHWGYKFGLIVLCILGAPVGFGLTMYVKYRTRKKKKKGPPKDKKDKMKK
jgi:uncharacterized membrane-anchored protein